MNGCHDDSTHGVVARHAGYEYRRCPRALFDADAAQVLALRTEKYLQALPPRERRRLPAKLVEAIEYVEQLKETRDGGD